jgi:di/tricarboxylate transporter
MSIEGWITVCTIGLLALALLSNRVGVDITLLCGLVILLIVPVREDDGWRFGVIAAGDAILGFAHPAVLMIGALFVVAAGLEETGGMEVIAQRLLGRPQTTRGAQVRMMGPVAVMSAIMNTTPVVAMYLPIISDWSRKLRMSPSKLLMPLSFAAILGGTCTMIGTASNVTVTELHKTYLDSAGIAESAADQFWSVGLVGVPCMIVGLAFVLATSSWLVPARRTVETMADDARRYHVEMTVLADSPIVGRSIEQAGLRHLPGLYLTEIEREQQSVPAVSPDVVIQAGDRLLFAGVLESVVDLRRVRGLVPATDQVEKVAADRRQRTLVEAVVSNGSPLVGRTVRESQFRTVYNAAIIAVHRNAQQVKGKIGDHTGFVKGYRNSPDFYLVSAVERGRPIRHERAWVAIAVLGMLVGLLAFSPFDKVTVALLCAILMIGTRCITGTIARNCINWQVLITIGAALGIGRAMSDTGAAAFLAHEILALLGDAGPRLTLAVVFLLTSVFAQIMTNNGAAVLMFPLTMAIVKERGFSPDPFVISLMIAAACNFMTPVGYQTNLMVYGPGGYRFTDFMRLGLPLTIIVGGVCIILAPLVYPI